MKDLLIVGEWRGCVMIFLSSSCSMLLTAVEDVLEMSKSTSVISQLMEILDSYWLNKTASVLIGCWMYHCSRLLKILVALVTLNSIKSDTKQENKLLISGGVYQITLIEIVAIFWQHIFVICFSSCSDLEHLFQRAQGLERACRTPRVGPRRKGRSRCKRRCSSFLGQC